MYCSKSIGHGFYNVMHLINQFLPMIIKNNFGTVWNHKPGQLKILAVPQSALVVSQLTSMEPLEPLNAMELTFF